MNNVCENFADAYDVTVKTKKTLCICYDSDNNATLCQVSLNCVKIPWQSTVKHLGNFLMYNVHHEADIYKKKGDFIDELNIPISKCWTSDEFVTIMLCIVEMELCHHIVYGV